MKIPSVGAELFDVDGGMDMTIDAFRDFAKAPKNGARVLQSKNLDSSLPVKVVLELEGSQIFE